jgi:hypothetical protein
MLKPIIPFEKILCCGIRQVDRIRLRPLLPNKRQTGGEMDIREEEEKRNRTKTSTIILKIRGIF